ncbi:MAG: hypothetical protein Q8L48_18555 [Archangium sp.]|nr:hypothetical protein [Archangium sp.]
MSLPPRFPLLAIAAALGLGACAGVSKGVAPAAPSAVALDWPTSGKALDHVDAFQNAAVKVGLISLQGGARMPEHASPLPVLLTAASGRGTVTTATGSYALDPGHAVFLPGGERHAVLAEQGEVLRIAVVAIKGGAPAAPHGH